MRGILIDWMVDLHYKLRMFPQTLFAAVTIIDIYLSKNNVTK
jgi:cyclin B